MSIYIIYVYIDRIVLQSLKNEPYRYVIKNMENSNILINESFYIL